MTDLVDRPIETIGETASSRFFIGNETAIAIPPATPVARSPLEETRLFHQMYSDVLPNPTSLIVQVGVGPKGQLVDVDQAGNALLTLGLDASGEAKREYEWQLTVTRKPSALDVCGVFAGRQVYGLLLAPAGKVRTASNKYNVQGLGQPAEPANLDLLTDLVLGMINLNRIKERVGAFRNHKKEAERHLGSFSIKGLGRFRYEERLAQQEKTVDSIGFSAIKAEQFDFAD